ncbi:4-O-beta-D-mannosyl-D-glucose phosphorylase [compost metagenome]
MTDLHDITQVIYKPAGYFIAPEGDERIGDVSNVVFSNGWIQDGDDVLIYYASSDTRMHVATTTIKQLIDYVTQTPEDLLTSNSSVERIIALIESNNKIA